MAPQEIEEPQDLEGVPERAVFAQPRRAQRAGLGRLRANQGWSIEQGSRLGRHWFRLTNGAVVDREPCSTLALVESEQKAAFSGRALREVRDHQSIKATGVRSSIH